MNETAVTFFQDMIVHHEAAVAMSEEYLSSAGPAELFAPAAKLARDIVKAQTAEIGWMKLQLSAGGKSATRSSGMSNMRM